MQEKVLWPRSDIAINRLRELRESKDMTISQLADYLYCSRRAIKRYERGERPIIPETIPAILHLFQIHVSELFPQFEYIEGVYQFTHLEVNGYTFGRMAKHKLDMIQYREDGTKINTVVKMSYEDSTLLNTDRLDGHILKVKREESGISATKFSEMLGCSRRALGRYERGERAIPQDKIEHIFNLLNKLKTHSQPENNISKEAEDNLHKENKRDDLFDLPTEAIQSENTQLLLPEQTELPWNGNYNILITNLRRIREEKRYSQEDLAASFSVPTEKIAAWEIGDEEIPEEYRYPLIKLLDVGPEKLFPQLMTFNGGATYIPIRMNVDGFRYKCNRGEKWPIKRYTKRLKAKKDDIYPKNIKADEFFFMDTQWFEGLPVDEIPTFDETKMSRQYRLAQKWSKNLGIMIVCETLDKKEGECKISHNMLEDPKRHFPLVTRCYFTHKYAKATALVLAYENGQKRLLHLSPYWKNSPFYERLKCDEYLQQGRIESIPVHDRGYACNWETQYFIWPDGQIICSDEAFCYTTPLNGEVWAEKEPVGYLQILDQYIMLFEDDFS